MQRPELFDVVELLTNMSEQKLRAGMQGAIVEVYDDAYAVEFANEDGETVELLALKPTQFVVVWRAASKSWVPVAEKVEALVAALPEEALAEVFDCARSAYSRQIAG